MRRRRTGPRPGGLTIAGPLVFLLVVWLGAYFAWRIEHGNRTGQGVVTHVVYPDTPMGRLAHDVFMPLRWMDARYLGIGSSMESGDRQDISPEA